MLQLPNEIRALIFGYVDSQTLSVVSITSRLLHAASASALLRHLVWRSHRRAEEHLHTFWQKYPDRERFVRSLSLKFTPALRKDLSSDPEPDGSEFDFDFHQDVLSKISRFHYSLFQLVLCGLAIPANFYALLDSLPHLRDLTIRQCVIPDPPPRLSCPPSLEVLTLVHLRPRRQRVPTYSPYFIHLFPTVTRLAIDHLGIATFPAPHSFPMICSPTNIVLAFSFPSLMLPTQDYANILREIPSENLCTLTVIDTFCYSPTRPSCPELDFWDTKLRFPCLHSVTAPLAIINALIRVTAGLQHVAVQGAIWHTHLATRLIDELQQYRHHVRSLALTLVSWDELVATRASEALPRLERLEILYQVDGEGGIDDFQPQPSKAFFATMTGRHLSKLPHLTTLCIHPFPASLYDSFQFPLRALEEPATPSFALVVEEGLRRVSPAKIEEMWRLLPNLQQVTLPDGDQALQTWIRHAKGQWRAMGNCRDYEAGWTSARAVPKTMYATHDPSIYE
ncbi:hypothetical protein MIND_00865100 [Mycena indigotica]|uniref:F-box domain-containing protein n=1 Tax=Mycena indigotica TaxID=2126181 RepID=A0A8H6SGH6_9AGAR|nr:uncharacterized protein MIND_00865100 [Mycena indigotica]KAF7299165.1 hypothetical protein MIND_00865100 [Mycena indigotica]